MKYLEYLILAIAIVQLMIIGLSQVLTHKVGRLRKSGIQNAALWWVAVYVLHYIQQCLHFYFSKHSLTPESRV